MTQFVQFNSPCDVVDLSVYKNFKFPQFRTVEIIGIKNLAVDSIRFKNSSGQIINLARSVGTDIRYKGIYILKSKDTILLIPEDKLGLVK